MILTEEGHYGEFKHVTYDLQNPVFEMVVTRVVSEVMLIVGWEKETVFVSPT